MIQVTCKTLVSITKTRSLFRVIQSIESEPYTFTSTGPPPVQIICLEENKS